jgi:uncharacterized repeat protein (TIGR03943 family)
VTALFQRWSQAVVLLAWGAVFTGFSLTGRTAALLHPMFRPLALGAGILMMLLAVATLWNGREPGTARDCSSRRGLLSHIGSCLVLLVPLGLAAHWCTGTFSGETIRNRPAVESAQGLRPKAASPQVETHTGPGRAEVIDLLYAAADPTLRTEWEGRKVELIGQLMQDPALPAGRFKVVRMFMICCAADARPVATLVDGALPTGLDDLGWVRVVGEATFPVENGASIAVLKATEVSGTAPPEETMLY